MLHLIVIVVIIIYSDTTTAKKKLIAQHCKLCCSLSLRARGRFVIVKPSRLDMANTQSISLSFSVFVLSIFSSSRFSFYLIFPLCCLICDIELCLLCCVKCVWHCAAVAMYESDDWRRYVQQYKRTLLSLFLFNSSVVARSAGTQFVVCSNGNVAHTLTNRDEETTSAYWRNVRCLSRVWAFVCFFLPFNQYWLIHKNIVFLNCVQLWATHSNDKKKKTIYMAHVWHGFVVDRLSFLHLVRDTTHGGENYYDFDFFCWLVVGIQRAHSHSHSHSHVYTEK